MSPRRMGKSKLIQFCYDKRQLKEGYYTFYIDILHTSSLAEFTYIFGQKVFDTLRSQSEKMLRMFVQGLKSLNAKFGFDAGSNMPTFSIELGDIIRPEYTLNEIFACLETADRPCIVAFDEFQQICKYPEKNIEALLRSHIQHLSNVNFIFAGSERHLISEMFLSSAKPFYNSTKQVELYPIVPEEYIPFVSKCFRFYDKNIEENDIQKVYQLFNGNTYCMQRTFHEAFINTSVGETCSLEIIRHSIADIIEDNGHAYSRMLSQIPARQKELLYAIAKEGKAEKITGGTFIKKHALLSASSVQAATKKLLDLDMITLENGFYFIPDNFLLLYIRQLMNGNNFLEFTIGTPRE
jgi:AAA+ ATPase superfamily predicted ATPase